MTEQFIKTLEYRACNRADPHKTDTIRLYAPRRIMET